MAEPAWRQTVVFCETLVRSSADSNGDRRGHRQDGPRSLDRFGDHRLEPCEYCRVGV